jgi:DNA-binding response OmpR family regulator
MILDIMLPKMNGLEILRETRGKGIKTPAVWEAGYRLSEVQND